MFFDDGSGEAQTQASAFADRFGGEKRLHDAGFDFGRDAGAVIGDGENDGVVLGGDVEADPAIRREISGGVEGVLQEIEEDLGDLDFAARDMQASVHKGGIEADGMDAEALLAQLEGVLDNLADGSALEGVGAAITGNLAEAFDDFADALGGLLDVSAGVLQFVQRHCP